ncbi:MAG: hypothetical protein AAFX62_14430 [Pseudomonadota bacterium]
MRPIRSLALIAAAGSLLTSTASAQLMPPPPPGEEKPAYVPPVRPLHARLAPQLHWSVAAIAYGVALWVFALYGMAHLIAGNAPFLGWGSITWVALWGHILFAVVAAAVIEARTPR